MKKLFILCLLPIVACQKETENPDNSTEQLIHTAVGNYWIYDRTSYTHDNVVEELTK